MGWMVFCRGGPGAEPGFHGDGGGGAGGTDGGV